MRMASWDRWSEKRPRRMPQDTRSVDGEGYGREEKRWRSCLSDFTGKNCLDPKKSYVNPKEGDRFICFFLEIENREGEEAFVHGGDFSLKNSDGTKYGDRADVLEPGFESRDLNRGEHTSGWLCFNIPEKVKKRDLVFRFEVRRHATRWMTFD